VGGEEFALIIPEIEREQGGRAAVETRAFELAETIRARVSSVLVQGATVTVSIGIATFPETGDTPDALIDAVDTMLWIASEAGGNTVRAEWLQDGEGSHDAEDEI
jgi:diguanylate cyclase (GGDEF)-like protein